MEKIKLVIWDLDETFWKGTLSEEGIEEIKENTEIVKILSSRGIINSISSKNNFDSARKKLIELGVWEYFIFPSINWQPKGIAIRDLIENCQLRDINVLFIDDNHLNLKEAKFYNENLNIAEPQFIQSILSHLSFKGKEDQKLSRLAQYKILEKKSSAKKLFQNDNLKFLESSNIQVELIQNDNILLNINRVVELLERTNQLNFTKIRSKKTEISSLLNDSDYNCALVRVKDNFGDYGLVGFYALNIKQNHLQHFTFSCRILNLGIAQYIYSILNFPSIKIVPEVAEQLDKITPNWISEISKNDKILTSNSKKNNNSKLRIFFKGGCDLQQMIFYLNANNFDIFEETNYVGENNFPIHQEHTQILLDSQSLSQEHKDYVQNTSFLPFADSKYYKTSLFEAKYDCVIISVLMDYTNELYLHKTKNILLPLGGYYNNWSDEENDETLLDSYVKKNVNVERDTLHKFRKYFKHIGQITPDKFTENLNSLRNLIDSNVPIIFINGAELESPNPKEKLALSRHIIMNKTLDKFIEKSDNTFLLDVREIVTNSKQLLNNIRHYDRESYKKLSLELLSILNSKVDNSIKISVKSKFKEKGIIKLLHKLKNKIIN